MNKYLEKIAMRKQVALLLAKTQAAGKITPHTHLPTLKGALKDQSWSVPSTRLSASEFFSNRKAQRDLVVSKNFSPSSLKNFKNDIGLRTGTRADRGIVAGYGSHLRGDFGNMVSTEKKILTARKDSNFLNSLSHSELSKIHSDLSAYNPKSPYLIKVKERISTLQDGPKLSLLQVNPFTKIPL